QPFHGRGQPRGAGAAIHERAKHAPEQAGTVAWRPARQRRAAQKQRTGRRRTLRLRQQPKRAPVFSDVLADDGPIARLRADLGYGLSVRSVVEAAGGAAIGGHQNARLRDSISAAAEWA